MKIKYITRFEYLAIVFIKYKKNNHSNNDDTLYNIDYQLNGVRIEDSWNKFCYFISKYNMIAKRKFNPDNGREAFVIISKL